MTDISQLFPHETTGLPKGLAAQHGVWESAHGGSPNKSSFCTRLYENGELFSWSDSRRAMESGKPTRHPAPYAWRLDAKVSSVGMKEVHKLIEAHFVTLPPGVTPSQGADQGLVVYRARSGDVEHMVVFGSSATADLPQVIKDIDFAIQSHIVPEAVPLDQA